MNRKRTIRMGIAIWVCVLAFGLGLSGESFAQACSNDYCEMKCNEFCNYSFQEDCSSAWFTGVGCQGVCEGSPWYGSCVIDP